MQEGDDGEGFEETDTTAGNEQGFIVKQFMDSGGDGECVMRRRTSKGNQGAERAVSDVGMGNDLDDGEGNSGTSNHSAVLATGFEEERLVEKALGRVRHARNLRKKNVGLLKNEFKALERKRLQDSQLIEQKQSAMMAKESTGKTRKHGIKHGNDLKKRTNLPTLCPSNSPTQQHPTPPTLPFQTPPSGTSRCIQYPQHFAAYGPGLHSILPPWQYQATPYPPTDCFPWVPLMYRFYYPADFGSNPWGQNVAYPAPVVPYSLDRASSFHEPPHDNSYNFALPRRDASRVLSKGGSNEEKQEKDGDNEATPAIEDFARRKGRRRRNRRR